MFRSLFPLLMTGALIGAVTLTAYASSFVPHSSLETPAGVVLADETGNRLMVQKGDKFVEVAHSPGCGLYHAVSPDGSRLGFKSISPDGQSPAVVDLGSNRTMLLHPPVPRAGQVSFTRDGRYGFTVGDSLVITDGTHSRSFYLGSYANLAPLSPDGMYAAYNNDDDQLFLLSLSDGSSRQITDGAGAYAYPQWSPDGTCLLYSSLGGDLKVYHLATGETVLLGEGFGPSWSHDSRFVVYYKKSIVNGVLTNTDLYMAAPDGRDTQQLTFSPDICETDPSFSRDNREVFFQAGTRSGVYVAPLQNGLLGSARLVVAPEALEKAVDGTPLFRLEEQASPSSGLDIPYVHQVWDTPDWFNGHAACAPTTAIMLLAYYAVLPRWDVGCSGPWYHVSSWGRYVCEQYSYRQGPFASAANDPNGTPAYGGYGFMWATGSPRTTMTAYYTRHGLWAQQSNDYPPHSAAVAEISAGYPYSMCVGLTSAGHLILAHGFGAESHTLLFNDPYGNKNMTGSGYPNLYGKNVLYDWPGYNNGNQNLQNVFWCIAVHASVPAQADTLVDDAQLEHGFTLNTQAPASLTRWKDMTQGYKGHFWYCKTTGATDRDTCFAVWQPTLPVAGPYEVSAFIQFSNATAARYRIYGAGGCDTVVVNQKAAGGSWLSLGVHQFDAGTTGYVVLGDGASPAGQEIVFDAMKWTFQSTLAAAGEKTGSGAHGFALLQNYPNPFNPSTTISYIVPDVSRVTVTVQNLLGQTAWSEEEKTVSPGTHMVQWSPAGVPTGVYFVKLTAAPLRGGRTFIAVRKMLYLR